MPKAKHHFVPKFYLRLFAADTERRQIHLHNLARNRSFLMSALKNQCYRNHFHGQDDELEDALAELESQLAPVVKEVVASSQLPSHESESHMLLLIFVAFQMLRTAREAERTNERIDKMTKQALAHDPRVRDTNWDEIRIGYQDPVLMGLQMAPDMAIYLSDLRMCLICSPEDTFITSDNPVFKYNQCYESVKGFSMRGMRSRGLQIFVPLSPRHILLLLDREAYTLQNTRNNIALATPDDVRFLNGLQVVNAEQNLYFNNAALLAEVEQTAHKFNSLRQSNAVAVEEHPEIEEESEQWKSSLIHIYDHMPDLKLNLSFLKHSKKTRQIPRQRLLKEEFHYRKTSINPFDPEGPLPKGAPPPPRVIRHAMKSHRQIYKRSLQSPR